MKFVIRGIEFVPCTGGEKTKQEKAMVRGKHAPSVKHRPAVPAGDGAVLWMWYLNWCCVAQTFDEIREYWGDLDGARWERRANGEKTY